LTVGRAGGGGGVLAVRAGLAAPDAGGRALAVGCMAGGSGGGLTVGRAGGGGSGSGALAVCAGLAASDAGGRALAVGCMAGGSGGGLAIGRAGGGCRSVTVGRAGGGGGGALAFSAGRQVSDAGVGDSPANT
jgi:hypothetical protein